MRYVSGPHYMHEPDWLKPGEATDWHIHKFPHNTVALAGDVLVELRDANGVETQHLLREGDAIRWALAPAGVEHRVTLINERSRAVCFFSHFDPTTGKALDAYSYRADAEGGYA